MYSIGMHEALIGDVAWYGKQVLNKKNFIDLEDF